MSESGLAVDRDAILRTMLEELSRAIRRGGKPVAYSDVLWDYLVNTSKLVGQMWAYHQGAYIGDGNRVMGDMAAQFPANQLAGYAATLLSLQGGRSVSGREVDVVELLMFLDSLVRYYERKEQVEDTAD